MKNATVSTLMCCAHAWKSPSMIRIWEVTLLGHPAWRSTTPTVLQRDDVTFHSRKLFLSLSIVLAPCQSMILLAFPPLVFHAS